MSVLQWVFVALAVWFTCGLLALLISSFMPWELSGWDRAKIFLMGPLMLFEILRNG